MSFLKKLYIRLQYFVSGRVPHLSILEKITVMTLFGISSVLILVSSYSWDPFHKDCIAHYTGVI